MRSSNKSRSRNKNNNRRNNVGNVVNRVFDSSGPEGKVRGTPQQIIEKYSALARDAQLSGDRINAENFAQHSEHYLRLLTEAQKEVAERQRAQEAQRAQQNQNKSEDQSDADTVEVPKSNQQDTIHPNEAKADPLTADDDTSREGSGLVETPESASEDAPKAEDPIS
ncbi:MAG: DUF4167 domain-containing protein [Pseudomonadota bacterium]